MHRTTGTSQTCTLLAIRMGSMDFSRILPTVGTTPLDSPEKYKNSVIIRSDTYLFFVRCSSTFFIGKICIKNDTFIRTVKILSFTWPSWSVSAPCLKLSHILSKVSLILWALGLSADQPLFSLIRYEKKKLGILLSSRNVISFRFPHSIHRSFKNVKCLLV